MKPILPFIIGRFKVIFIIPPPLSSVNEIDRILSIFFLNFYFTTLSLLNLFVSLFEYKSIAIFTKEKMVKSVKKGIDLHKVLLL